jgi:hypothetical protein
LAGLLAANVSLLAAGVHSPAMNISHATCSPGTAVGPAAGALVIAVGRRI